MTQLIGVSTPPTTTPPLATLVQAVVNSVGALDRCVTAAAAVTADADDTDAMPGNIGGGPGVFEVVILAAVGIIVVGVLQLCVCELLANGEDSGLVDEAAADVGVPGGTCVIGCDMRRGRAFASSTGPFCSGTADWDEVVG